MTTLANTAQNPLVLDGRQRVYYHRVGRPQSDDQLVYENAENPSLSVRAAVVGGTIVVSPVVR